MLPDLLADRLEHLRVRVAEAARRAGRSADEVTLVAVTKTHPPETLQLAYEAGLRDFGENRVAELVEKRGTLALPEARWHFIGHIQSRKARDLVGQADLIHSVDRLSLAEELSRRSMAAETPVAVLLQVNSSGEASKGGWHTTGGSERDLFFREVEALLALPGLHVRGLMTIAPFVEEAEAARPVFAALGALRRVLAERFDATCFQMLSMGMTNDFEVAIEEGATHVRVGTALFGPRP